MIQSKVDGEKQKDAPHTHCRRWLFTTHEPGDVKKQEDWIHQSIILQTIQTVAFSRITFPYIRCLLPYDDLRTQYGWLLEPFAIGKQILPIVKQSYNKELVNEWWRYLTSHSFPQKKNIVGESRSKSISVSPDRFDS